MPPVMPPLGLWRGNWTPEELRAWQEAVMRNVRDGIYF